MFLVLFGDVSAGVLSKEYKGGAKVEEKNRYGIKMLSILYEDFLLKACFTKAQDSAFR